MGWAVLGAIMKAGSRCRAKLFSLRNKWLLLLFVFFFLVIVIGNLHFRFNKRTLEEFLKYRTHDELLISWKQRISNLSSSIREITTIKRTKADLKEMIKSRSLNDFNFRFLLNKPVICSNLSDAKYLIGVISSPGNFEMRQTIRQTWGSAIQIKTIKLIFLLGNSADTSIMKKIHDEDFKYQDIVQADFTDSYRNLTLKSVLLLWWKLKYCNAAQFVIKVDDDVYISVLNLLEIIAKYKAEIHSIIGFKVGNASVERRKNHKFYISEELYHNQTYPSYLAGPCYIMTGDSIFPLYTGALNVSVFPMEDVYLTGFCAGKVGINVIHEPKMDTTSLDLLDVCVLRKQVNIHHVSPGMMVSLWVNEIMNTSTCLKTFEGALNSMYKIFA